MVKPLIKLDLIKLDDIFSDLHSQRVVVGAEINPSKYNTIPFSKHLKKLGNLGKEFHFLYNDIKLNGIKYPVLLRSTNGKVVQSIGKQRVAIATELGFSKINAIICSRKGDVNHEGKQLKNVSEITKKYGKNILKQPVIEYLYKSLLKYWTTYLKAKQPILNEIK